MTGEIIKEQLQSFYDELPPWGKAIAAGALALTLYIPYKYYISLPRKSPLKEDFKKGMVYLYQFPRVRCIPSLSPFCLKLETWLRMADIPYENAPCGWNVRSCEGTLPFVELDGVEHPDSALAIRDLTEAFSKEAMESHLNEEQRATSRAFEAMAESSLLMSVVRIRYIEHTDEVFKQFPEDAFGIFTPIVCWFMKRSLISKVLTILKAAGIGKHSRDEIVYIGNEDLKAISHYLGSKHYFTGFKPTRVDATLFSVLAQIVYAPYDMPQKKLIMDELTNLKDYCDRMRGRYWPDWEECTTKFTMNSEWKKKV